MASMHAVGRRRVAGSAPTLASTADRVERFQVRLRRVDLADAADPGHDLARRTARCSSFSATAPAATRPMVSRALERPPPLAARMPYFTLVGVVGVGGPRNLSAMSA